MDTYENDRLRKDESDARHLSEGYERRMTSESVYAVPRLFGNRPERATIYDEFPETL